MKKSNQLGNPLAVAKLAAKASGVVNATKNTAKNYPGFFTLAGVGVLGLLGYTLIKKVKKDNEDKIQNQNETNFSNNLNSSVLKDSTGASYNPREIASKYKQAIYGAGTSEQALMDLARMSKNGRWAEISKQYKTLTGGALTSHLQDELNTEEYSLFLDILKSTYWYAIGEYVYPKKTTVKALDNTNKVINGNVYWNVGSLGKITAAKRVRLSGEITEFYKTEDYPSFWIWVDDLYTKYNRVG